MACIKTHKNIYDNIKVDNLRIGWDSVNCTKLAVGGSFAALNLSKYSIFTRITGIQATWNASEFSASQGRSKKTMSLWGRYYEQLDRE